jgi:hypothetical protein
MLPFTVGCWIELDGCRRSRGSPGGGTRSGEIELPKWDGGIGPRRHDITKAMVRHVLAKRRRTFSLWPLTTVGASADLLY